MLLLSYFFSFLSGILERKNCVPLKYSRKFFNTIGKIFFICSLVRMGYIVHNTITIYSICQREFITNNYIIPNIGHWVPMCALIALGFVTSDEKDLAIFLLVVAVGINAATYLGFQVCFLKQFSLKTNKHWFL